MSETNVLALRYAITISHQLGSGGAYLGERLSARLGIPFIDRQILKEISQQLHVAESDLASREERLSSFWESFTHMATMVDPVRSLSPNSYIPTDQELFELEMQTIGQIAEKNSAIFIGRCGRYILQDHPHHIAILVYADKPNRIDRLCSLFHLKPDEAKKLIKVNDRERTAYIRNFAREDLFDARLYDLCVNTSRIGLDNTVDHVVACVQAKIQEFQNGPVHSSS